MRMRGQGEISSGRPAAPANVSASPAVRSLRAVVFAALCVLPAAGGHALAMGAAPPVWVQVAAVLQIFAIAFLLGGRERSLTGIGGGTLATRGGLRLAFDATRPSTALAMPGMSMSHAHAMTPHATAVHVGAALVLTWWLRRVRPRCGRCCDGRSSSCRGSPLGARRREEHGAKRTRRPRQHDLPV